MHIGLHKHLLTVFTKRKTSILSNVINR